MTPHIVFTSPTLFYVALCGGEVSRVPPTGNTDLRFQWQFYKAIRRIEADPILDSTSNQGRNMPWVSNSLKYGKDLV
jgi:hypothetical protein